MDKTSILVLVLAPGVIDPAIRARDIRNIV